MKAEILCPFRAQNDITSASITLQNQNPRSVFRKGIFEGYGWFQYLRTQPEEYYKLCYCSFDLFLFLELAHIQVVVETFLREQFIMFAALDNLAIFQHQNHIGIADG
jgi:hypothetical protein